MIDYLEQSILNLRQNKITEIIKKGPLQINEATLSIKKYNKN